MNNLGKLFNPESIAVVGASEEAGKIGNIISKNLLELGYSGKVFFINQKHKNIFGKECFGRLSDITSNIDLAIIAIPAKFVCDVVRESADRIKNYVIISAGFAETDAEGKAREKELSEIAKEYNLNILGPNCLGFIAPKVNLNASFGAGMVKSGNISFVSQSGALISSIMDISSKESFGFSHIVSVGNKMQIDETQMLEFLSNDPDTKVIGMYLEGIKNGENFIETVGKVSKIKPVVVLKAGKSEKAQQAISSHTGALAGSDEVMDAVFAKCGVVRANNLDEFFGLLKIVSNLENFPSEKIAVVTNAGGAGVLTTDAFFKKEIKLAELEEGLKQELRSFLPKESSVENPVDLLGDALEDRYQKALEILDKQLEMNTIIAVLTPQNQTPSEKIAEVLVKFKNISKKNVVAIFIGGKNIEKAVSFLNKNEIAVFPYPEQAVFALNKYFIWRKESSEKFFSENEKVDEGRRGAVLEIIKKAQEENRNALRFEEASQIFSTYGLNACRSWTIEAGKEPKGDFNFPVVAKVNSDKVLHKSDQEGLILNIKNVEELYEATAKISASFPNEKIIIQEMAEKGTEIILGIKKDPTFGSIVVFGLGGIYTEVFKIVDFLIPPVNTQEVVKFLGKSKLEFLFKGARGQRPYNLQEFSEILVKIQRLALEIPEIKELDVNPLFIYNNDRSAVAVDIKIIF